MQHEAIPWFKGVFHIPDAFWHRYEYLDLYPLDGGASFIVDEFVGSRDDRTVAEKIMSGELLQPWGTPGNMDWMRFQATRHLELHMWLQRWYCIPSLARCFWLDRNEACARTAFALMEDWAHCVGYPANEAEVIAAEEQALAFDYKFQRDLLPSLDEPCPWVWYDFQPAYRLLVLLCSTHLLRESDALRTHADDLLRWIRAHADAILWVTRRYGYKYGNHHTLRMMALYLAGVLIDDENAGFWRETAMEMQTRHLAEDFFEDGMYKESLPGYTPFVLTHFREVLLASRANGLRIPALYEDTVCKCLRLLKTMVMPDGMLPVINDGPRIGIAATVELIEHYYPDAGATRSVFHVNRASGFPVFRDEQDYLVFDANFAHGTHVQAGKLGFILWRGGEPFIIEGGCCSYDNPEFQSYFRRGWAHSTLLVDGEEDAVWKSFWVWAERAHPVIREYAEGDQPFVEAESDGFERLGIGFARRIDRPNPHAVVVTDTITNHTKTRRSFAFRFMLAQEDIVIDAPQSRVCLRGKHHALSLHALLPSEIQLQQLKTNFFGDMRTVSGVDFVRQDAADFTQVFTLTFSKLS